MESHVYRNEVFIDSDDSLGIIARRVPHGSLVLELGPATGYLTRFLYEELGCTVDAVEWSPAMAEEARPWCRRLVVADLEDGVLADLEPGYDVVICADVLEHLYEPGAVLRQLPQLLGTGGKLIFSIPNMAYAGLILDLIAGSFQYREEGLLDKSHIRFFTRASFVALLESAGLEATAVEPVRVPFEHSEFYGHLELLTVPLKNYLFSLPDADAYQFIVEARPAAR